MKTLVLGLMLIGCATSSPYSNVEPACPAHLTSEQVASGLVQYRALCASWGRDMITYDSDCRCVCAAARGAPRQNPNTQM